MTVIIAHSLAVTGTGTPLKEQSSVRQEHRTCKGAEMRLGRFHLPFQFAVESNGRHLSEIRAPTAFNPIPGRIW